MDMMGSWGKFGEEAGLQGKVVGWWLDSNPFLEFRGTSADWR